MIFRLTSRTPWASNSDALSIFISLMLIAFLFFTELASSKIFFTCTQRVVVPQTSHAVAFGLRYPYFWFNFHEVTFIIFEFKDLFLYCCQCDFLSRKLNNDISISVSHSILFPFYFPNRDNVAWNLFHFLSLSYFNFVICIVSCSLKSSWLTPFDTLWKIIVYLYDSTALLVIDPI